METLFARITKHRSWLISASLAVGIALWLVSGQLGGSEASEESTVDARAETQTSVRVRTQSAEEVQRTIVVNGKTAPARIVQLSAETDGRVEAIGAARGSNVDRGGLIVMLDERDRSARLAQAEATVRQREVEFEARQSLSTSSYVSEA